MVQQTTLEAKQYMTKLEQEKVALEDRVRQLEVQNRRLEAQLLQSKRPRLL